MAVTLVLTTDPEGRVTPTLNGEPLAPPTPLADLPRLPPPPRPGEPSTLSPLQLDPTHVGRPLYAALGGDQLRAALAGDPDGVLLLAADDRAAAIPWEFTPLPDGGFLACDYGLLRLLPDLPPAPAGRAEALHVLALATDPLVDERGQPRDRYRLGLERELAAIRGALDESGIALRAFRVPPTRQALQEALAHGPAILHLTCHGSVVATDVGPQAVLELEDNDGKATPLLGRDLQRLPPRGVLRLVVLSACRTDAVESGAAGLARALVRNGIPAAVGMQAEFPDQLSGDFAASLYRFLLAGHSLAEALRQARQTLLPHLEAFGLPVGYTSAAGWGPLPRREGTPETGGLARLGNVRRPAGIDPPRELLGREADLHGLARRFSEGKRVVTVVGTGGVGKTALAAAFVERFGWRWRGGVTGVSFANAPADAGRVARELGQTHKLGGAAAAADASQADLEAALLERVRGRDLLIFLDNYETVIQGCQAHEPASLAVHSLATRLAEAGASLLLTSRQEPAGLPGEALYPFSETYANLGKALRLRSLACRPGQAGQAWTAVRFLLLRGALPKGCNLSSPQA